MRRGGTIADPRGPLRIPRDGSRCRSWPGKPRRGPPPTPRGGTRVRLGPDKPRRGRGGLPVKFDPRQNQAIWIEVYIGRERAPGLYRGTIDVGADAVRRTIPIELEVFSFTLPDENSMHAMLYYSSDQAEL